MSQLVYKFRNAVVGGFDRRDVTDYIERITHENSQAMDDLTKQLENMKRENAELAASLENLRNEKNELVEQEARVRESLEESSRSLMTVRGELQTTRTQLAVAKKELHDLQRKVQEMEPMVTHYQALKDRVATVELDAHQKAQATVERAEQEVEALCADTTKWMKKIQGSYDKLREQVSQYAAEAAHAEDSFMAMEEEYRALLLRGTNGLDQIMASDEIQNNVETRELLEV